MVERHITVISGINNFAESYIIKRTLPQKKKSRQIAIFVFDISRLEKIKWIKLKKQ